ncbi:ABC transporter ATP-binding protein [Bacillus haikouensis]|nr:ABC transporter ATP-binding protein [Bacillus haikouensis]
MINIQNIKKSFNKAILKDVNFELENGKVYCLLGRNGAGKTTLMKILSGIMRQDSGEIMIDQKKGVEEYSHYVSEAPIFLDYLSGYENLRFIQKLNKIPMSEEEMDHFIKHHQLVDFAHELVVNYSQGMKHQLSLACAFLIEPVFLLLDEPLVSLDPVNIVDMHNRLKAYADKGNIVFISTHMLPIAHKIGDEILILKDGEVTQVSNDYTEKELQSIVLNAI